MQDIFVKNLQNNAKSNKSFIYEVADVLDIGYDAAYRRIHSKTQLTLEEAVRLALHFNVSLNNLYEVENQNTILTTLSYSPVNEQGLELWLKELYSSIALLTKFKKSEVIWSGKDISPFRTLTNSCLAKYKLYVWLKDLNPEMTKSKVTFDEWIISIPKSLLSCANAIGDLGKHINICELWNENTINGTLQQIQYYFEEGMISKLLALKICDNLRELINSIEHQTENQSLNILENKKYFKLYESDLNSLTNTLMMVSPKQKAFFIPFTVLDYFKIEHKETCDKMYSFLQKQKSVSKLLASSGEHDRNLFFKKMQQKISMVVQKIKLNDEVLYL